jgi:hypothetical protein
MKSNEPQNFNCETFSLKYDVLGTSPKQEEFRELCAQESAKEDARLYSMLNFNYRVEDSDTVTNDKRIEQARIDVRPELIPPTSVKVVSRILKSRAEQYGQNNWRGISIQDHLSLALMHIYTYIEGVESDEDDIGNATCHLLFALDLINKGNTRF